MDSGLSIIESEAENEFVYTLPGEKKNDIWLGYKSVDQTKKPVFLYSYPDNRTAIFQAGPKESGRKIRAV